MKIVVLAAVLAAGVTACRADAGGALKKYADRERHPLAPSLPLLTDKETEAIEAIIERFVQWDIGKLKGPAGTKAVEDFKALGPEAIPALLEGLNKAANMEQSCPAVLIAKKLAQFLSSSQDQQLLEFAREHIGAGVTAKRHLGVIKDLKFTCQLRRGYLQRVELAGGKGAAGKAPRLMTVAELTAAAGRERGARLKEVLLELEKRQGPQVLEALTLASRAEDREVKEMARELLGKHLGRRTAAELKLGLKHKQPEVRAAAAQVVGNKGLRLGAELIELLADAQGDVSQAARVALVQLSDGQNHGPQPGATAEEVAAAVRAWRAWWARQEKR